MRIRFLLPLLLAPALATPALAQLQQAPEPTEAELQQAQQRAEAWQAYSLRVARALGRSDGARDLALAAVLEATARPHEGATALAPDASRWRAEAATRGAGDTITQQLLVAAGLVGDEPAAATAAARRWQSLEPGNLAPAMYQGLDAGGVLAAAAQSGRNTPDPYLLQRWIAGVLRGHPPTAAEWEALGEGQRPSDEVHAAAWAASLQGLLLPDYRDVLGACSGRQLGAPGRAVACGHMAQLLLARPQTVLDERIGLSMAREQAGSAAEASALDARRRGVDWRQEQLAELAMRDAGEGTAFARLLADPAIDTEDALGRRLLSAAGVALEPPPEWQAPWQRRR